MERRELVFTCYCGAMQVKIGKPIKNYIEEVLINIRKAKQHKLFRELPLGSKT